MYKRIIGWGGGSRTLVLKLSPMFPPLLASLGSRFDMSSCGEGQQPFAVHFGKAGLKWPDQEKKPKNQTSWLK